MGVWDSPAANARQLRQKALQAFQANATYLALPTPTAGDAIIQVTRLTREMNGLIRLLFDELDDISDS